MRELGRILRSTRESLGFDLDEIEEKTKIRKRYLLALEEGDWSVLPGRVYARGFVRSYADVLGLDGLELLQQHVDGRELEPPVETVDKVARPTPPEPVRDEPSGSVSADSQGSSDGQQRKAVARIAEPRQSVEVPRKSPQVQQSQERSSRRLAIGGGVGQGLIIAAALAVVAGGYFALRGHHNPPTRANTGTASVVNNASSTTTGNETTNAVSANATAKNATNSVANNTTTTTPPPAAVVTAGPLQNGAHTYTVKNAQNLKVQLKVQTGQLWIQVQSDSKMVDPNDILNPGDSRTFSGTSSILLRLGHVQGVQLTVNGQPVTLPDTPNAVNILIEKQ